MCPVRCVTYVSGRSRLARRQKAGETNRASWVARLLCRSALSVCDFTQKKQIREQEHGEGDRRNREEIHRTDGYSESEPTLGWILVWGGSFHPAGNSFWKYRDRL